ncbi:MAG: hypothetical protein KF727_10270 [Microbacteriaceae bacterium]|nr:hypothetical protein [Microbacteriaceae bacterium]
MSFSIDGLRDYGFVGFVPFRTWDRSMVGAQDAEGVYAIVRSANPPSFLEDDGSKPRSRSWSRSEVAARWVPRAEILYFGKAPLRTNLTDGVAKRLDEFHSHGYRTGKSHYGGRLLWQLKDAADLLVAWKLVPVGTAGLVESGLILGFVDEFGMPPFANVGAPLRAAKKIAI